MISEITTNDSIQEIINNAENGDILLLNDGIYREKIEIWIDGLTIKAKNPGKVIISNNDYYHKIMKNHNECNTFNTFTVLVGGNDVTIENIIIENSSTPSTIYGQAVALHVLGNNFNCLGCTIKSAQDTLFTGPLPDDLIIRYNNFYDKKRLNATPSAQTYNNCTIIGDVDFIFGGAVALFEDCDIKSLHQNNLRSTYICALSHSERLRYGYLFNNCRFTGTSPAYLARPWRDYGCVAFINCQLGDYILPEGFNKWDNTNRDKTARFYEYTLTDTSKRVSWSHQLNFEQAKKYVKDFKEYQNKIINKLS